VLSALTTDHLFFAGAGILVIGLALLAFFTLGDPEGPMGAKGLGEHVLIPTAPAILNAIRHASGAAIRKVPALPHRVLAAIKAI